MTPSRDEGGRFAWTDRSARGGGDRPGRADRPGPGPGGRLEAPGAAGPEAGEAEPGHPLRVPRRVRPAFEPPARQIGDHARDLAGLIGELGLERPTVFGVSFGGAVALEFAVERTAPGRPADPLRGRGAVPVDPGLDDRPAGPRAVPAARRQPVRQPVLQPLPRRQARPGPMPRFIVERCWETDQGVMARRLAMLEGFDVTDRLWRLDAPTLILAGYPRRGRPAESPEGPRLRRSPGPASSRSRTPATSAS